MTTTAVAQSIDQFRERFSRITSEVGRRIVGHEQVVSGTVTALLAGGHVLLEGIPGVGKTSLVRTLADVLHLRFSRIQFTPDLMPADIVGSEIMDEDDRGRRSFRFVQGPVFCQLLMADEINRASPRTQSALLQAMQEKHVTVAGQRYDLPRPFHVLATQNPLEQEGTYPLPEAQLDRFVMQIDVPYPDLDAERRMLFATTGTDEQVPMRVFGGEDLIAAQRLVRRIPVGDKVVEAILNLVRSSRPDEAASEDLGKQVAWGPGPRASQALMLGARARCLMDGRLSPSIDDVAALAGPVLRHRMALTFAARADGVTIDGIIDRLCRGL
jgi:MoxR-like ATPase